MVKMSSAVGVALAVSPLRPLISLRRDLRLKVSLETVPWLQACAHSVTTHFHHLEGDHLAVGAVAGSSGIGR